MIIICIIMASFAPSIVSILFGVEFFSSSSVIRILLPGIFFMVIVKILHADLAGRGFPIYGLWVSILPLVINIILNIILIPIYEIEGAAIASSISYTLAGVLFLYIYSKKEGIKVSSMLVINKQDFNMIISKVKNITLDIK
ncbi:MAG: polysaccharide biosynthesis C-terminal domain-containing protein [Alkalibacterium sp.]|nr:polysaccharide biosynthesis C-terminal domain-containing protein [Alkalibacterium sp.]